MKFDALFDNKFCECTPRNKNTCPICQKPMPYVDSPFGAIPSLELMDRFCLDLKKNLDQFKESIQANVEQSVEPIIDEFQGQFGELFNQMKNQIKKNQEDFAGKMKQYAIKTQEITDQMQNQCQETQANLEQKITQFEVKTQGITDKRDKQINERLKILDQKEANLQHFIDKLYGGFGDILNFLMKSQAIIYDLIQKFQISKAAYIEILLPQLEKMIEKIEIFTRIFPKKDVFSIGTQNLEVQQLFEIDCRYYNSKALEGQKAEFQNIWDRHSFSISPDSLESNQFPPENPE